jgi:hypothetical protein
MSFIHGYSSSCFRLRVLKQAPAVKCWSAMKVSRSGIRFSSEDVKPALDEKTIEAESKALKKMIASDYNNRRAAYNRRVSLLRREYADMVAKQRAADKAEKEALARELTRRRLERQRQKNLRSAQNAINQEKLRLQREDEFNEHLRKQQLVRDETKRRFDAARQLIIQELEEESSLWLTTPEEVEARFTPEAEQRLWAPKRGGVLGAPNPSLDSHFWQYETHTWHMNKTYKTKRQVLLEDLEKLAYQEANVDSSYWTDERLEEQIWLEEKARLRSMVRSAGRQALLKKQRQMIDESLQSADQDIPIPKPAPSMKLWTNDAALEKEGARILMNDPTKFFVFEKENIPRDTANERRSHYEGPALGEPIALRDPLRHGSDQGSVFPVAVGKIPKPDKRSEREKKQQEREDRMLAAAAEQGPLDVDLAAEQQTVEDLQPDLDYDDNDWNSDDEEWTRGLNSEIDADILNTPSERRYTEEEIDWVLKTLDGKLKYHEQQFSVEFENMKQKVRSEARQKSGASDPIDKESLEAVLLTLSEKEIMALSDLDDTYSSTMSDSELSKALVEIPSLSKEQVLIILNRDRSIEN